MVEILWVRIPPRRGDVAAMYCVAYLPSVEKVFVFVKASTALVEDRTGSYHAYKLVGLKEMQGCRPANHLKPTTKIAASR